MISKKYRFLLLAAFPLGANLGGVHSNYTKIVLDIAQHFPSPTVQAARPDPEKPILLRCIETEGHPFYMGLEQEQWIAAPLETVEKIVDDIDSYRGIFPGFAEIKVTHRDENKWETHWEEKVPIPLIPNIQYEMTYLLHQASADRKIYRYQLKSSKDLIASDGLIVIERDPADRQRTRYVEYDFYDANWGFAKTFGQEKLWRENVEGIALSDLGIRIKAENPGKDGEWVRSAARKLLFSSKAEVKCETKVSASTYFEERSGPAPSR